MYSVIQINETQFAIKVGNSVKGEYRYIKNSVTTDEAKAISDVSGRNAIILMKKVAELQKLASLTDSADIARHGYAMCDTYEERAEKEDPNFRAHDPKAYLC